MARGDRLLSRVIEEAWQRGARLDAWSEHFDLHIWLDAAKFCKVDTAHYLRRRDLAETLPWQHLDIGVEREFLEKELQKSLAGVYTKDCRVHGCQMCGVCDFKNIRPRVECLPETPESGRGKEIIREKTNETVISHHWYRMYYAKQGDIRFLSHLEVIQVFFQAFRRAGIKLHYTQGFNPVPKASFSPALPVGTESLAEYLDVDLLDEIVEFSDFLQGINIQLPEGLAIQSAARIPNKKTVGAAGNFTSYTISLPHDLSAAARKALKNFMERDSFLIEKIRKGRKRSLDIRKQVHSLVFSGDNGFEMILRSEEGKTAGKPVEIVKAVLDLSDEECLAVRILKVWTGSLPA